MYNDLYREAALERMKEMQNTFRKTDVKVIRKNKKQTIVPKNIYIPLFRTRKAS